jgi:hypothetical protein
MGVAVVAVAAVVEYAYDSPIRKRLLAALAPRSVAPAAELAADALPG